MIYIDPLIPLDTSKQYFGRYDPITNIHEYYEMTKPDNFISSQITVNEDGTTNIMGSDAGNDGNWAGQMRVFQDVNTGGFQLHTNWNINLAQLTLINITISQYDNTFSVDGNGNASGNMLDTDNPNPNDIYFSKVYPAIIKNQNYYFYVRQNYSGGGYAWSYYYNSSTCNLTTPSLTYNSTNNIAYLSNTSDNKVIEYRRVVDNNIYNKSSLARKLFYSSTFDNTENSELYRSTQSNLRRWDDGNYKLSVRRLASVSQDYYELSMYYIAQWVYDFNIVVPTITFDIVMDGSEGDINLTIGSHMELFGYSPASYDLRYGGTFDISADASNRIYHAEVKISTGVDARYEGFTTHKKIIYEELTQPMGMINDCTDVIGYIPCEYGYPEKNNDIVTGVNREILDLLYNSGFGAGSFNTTVATTINAINGGVVVLDNANYLNFLSPNVQYEIRAYTYSYSGNFALPSDWLVITTPITIPPPSPSSPTIQSRVDGGFNLSWGNVGADYYTLWYKVVGAYSYTNIWGIQTNQYSLLNLQYGTSYSFYVQAVNDYGYNFSSINIGTTAPKIPTISSTGGIGGNVNVNISGMVGNWTYIKIWYKRYSDSGWISSQIDYPNTSVNITGLNIGDTYQFKASSFYHVNNVDLESRDSNGNIGYSNELSVLITSRPENFYFSGIYSGADITVSGKNIYPLSASSWNSFLSRINEFRVYKGLGEATYELRYSGDEITKERFNQARYNLVGLNIYFTGGNTLLPARVSGNNILDSNIFLNLTNCLNSIA